MVITDKSHLTATPEPEGMKRLAGVGFAYCVRDRSAVARADCRCAGRAPLRRRKQEKPSKGEKEKKTKTKKKDEKVIWTNQYLDQRAARENSPMNPQRPKFTLMRLFLIQPRTWAHLVAG